MSHYVTADHEPPNGGIPSDRVLATYSGQSQADRGNDGPPNGGIPRGHVSYYAPPPALMMVPLATLPFLSTPWVGDMPCAPRAMAAPARAYPPTMSQPKAQARACSTAPRLGPVPYEPPGQRGPGGLEYEMDGASYIFPDRHALIHFVGDGVRPCDYERYPHHFRYSRHRVPCSMKMRDLLRKLGCPAGHDKGVSEMRYAGADRWIRGETYTQGEDGSGRTIARIGWGAQRNEPDPVWLVVKR